MHVSLGCACLSDQVAFIAAAHREHVCSSTARALLITGKCASCVFREESRCIGAPVNGEINTEAGGKIIAQFVLVGFIVLYKPQESA